MSKVTRIDVDVNIQNAKNKIREVADDINRQNNRVNTQAGSSSVSGGAGAGVSEKAQDVASMISQYRQIQRQEEQKIRREFEGVRKANMLEHQEYQQRHQQGLMSDTDFEKHQERYQQEQVGTFGEEREAIAENTSKTNELIQQLIDKQDAQTKDEVTRAQRDTEETQFGGAGGKKKKGILGGLFDERSALMDARMGATTDKELKDINKQLDRVNKDIGKKMGGGGKMGLAGFLMGAGDVTEAFAAGNPQGGATGMMMLLSKMGPYGIAAAAIAAIIGGSVSSGNKRDTAISTLTPFRAYGDRFAIDEQIRQTPWSIYGYKESIDYANKRKELALGAGRSFSATDENAIAATAMEKGYGINNVAQLSAYERQERYSKTTSENIVEMLNVLTAIKDGSMTAQDFTLANEKANLMNRLQGSFTSRQESFDNRQILGLMTAFEKLGGEGKDQRAGDFIEGTMNAMREGGSKNAMLLKYQWAAQAHPELRGDQAALNRIVEEGTDPKYMRSFMEGMKKYAGGDRQNEYFTFKTMMPGLTPSMRQKWIENANNEEIFKNMAGKGLGDSGAASIENAINIVRDNVNFTQTVWADMKKEAGSLGKDLKNFMTSIFGTGAVPVDIRYINVADKNRIPGAKK